MKLFFMLFCVALNAQIHRGHIQYGVVIGDIEAFSDSKYLKNGFQKAVENAPYLSYSLKFKDSFSEFRIDPTTGIDDSGMAFAKIYSNYTGPIVQDHQFSYTFTTGEFGKFIIKKPNKTDWKLTTESKKIGNYSCYKALSEYVVVNPKGTFVFPVIAWFCPELPLPYGPLGYGNLPGLILELQVRNVIYGVRTIDLDPSQKIDIPEIDNQKIITEEAHNLLIQKAMDELAEKNKRTEAQRKFEELSRPSN